ncbi:BQ5605_C010g06116 [Microbotryum silenes-dioicae]|uniref:BQ5605_C010g06116 protein n=1 Tax=Microbotryum silenes-dioicae TaxID=796604 RepID=A0A2X0NUJ9_9BASI|nr:BQ5605_C010g06116 [Microbotryum silenes-dioicae]
MAARTSSALWAYLFALMVVGPGIGLTFLPEATCVAFNLTSITSSTLHLSRLIGVRNIVFGVMLLATPRGSTEYRTTAKLVALTEALDVGIGYLSYHHGDMAAKDAIQSSVAAGVTALIGWKVLQA